MKPTKEQVINMLSEDEKVKEMIFDLKNKLKDSDIYITDTRIQYFLDSKIEIVTKGDNTFEADVCNTGIMMINNINRLIDFDYDDIKIDHIIINLMAQRFINSWNVDEFDMVDYDNVKSFRSHSNKCYIMDIMVWSDDSVGKIVYDDDYEHWVILPIKPSNESIIQYIVDDYM